MAALMTDERLAEIRARLARRVESIEPYVAIEDDVEDLLVELDRLRAEVGRLNAAIDVHHELASETRHRDGSVTRHWDIDAIDAARAERAAILSEIESARLRNMTDGEAIVALIRARGV